MKYITIPVFIPEAACPQRCIFCNQRLITGKKNMPSTASVIDTVERHLQTIDIVNTHVELAFFGGNFTGLAVHEQISYMETIQPYIDRKFISSIRISTRPDYISESNLVILKQYRVKTIELGVQSLDDEVLKISGRGYSTNIVQNAAKMIVDNGFVLGMQMMIGLPNDTKEKSFHTAQKIIALKAKEVRIYPCLVFKNTVLADWFYQKQYHSLRLEEAVDWTVPILELFIENQIKVLRVGLHPTDDLIKGINIVDGPFHVSFKELVLSAIWRKKIIQILSDANDLKRHIEVKIPCKTLNYVIGYKGQNKKEYWAYAKKIRFVEDEQLKDFECYVCHS